MRSFGRRFLAGILTVLLLVSLFAGHMAEASFAGTGSGAFSEARQGSNGEGGAGRP